MTSTPPFPKEISSRAKPWARPTDEGKSTPTTSNSERGDLPSRDGLRNSSSPLPSRVHLHRDDTSRDTSLHRRDLLLRAWRTWREAVTESAIKQRTAAVLELRRRFVALQDAFFQWKSMAQRGSDLRRRANAFSDMLSAGVKTHAWGAWTQYVETRRGKAEAREAAFRHHVDALLRRTFLSWRLMATVHQVRVPHISERGNWGPQSRGRFLPVPSFLHHCPPAPPVCPCPDPVPHHNVSSHASLHPHLTRSPHSHLPPQEERQKDDLAMELHAAHLAARGLSALSWYAGQRRAKRAMHVEADAHWRETLASRAMRAWADVATSLTEERLDKEASATEDAARRRAARAFGMWCVDAAGRCLPGPQC